MWNGRTQDEYLTDEFAIELVLFKTNVKMKLFCNAHHPKPRVLGKIIFEIIRSISVISVPFLLLMTEARRGFMMLQPLMIFTKRETREFFYNIERVSSIKIIAEL